MQQNEEVTLVVMARGVDADVELHFRMESCAVALCTAANDASERPCEEPR